MGDDNQREGLMQSNTLTPELFHQHREVTRRYFMQLGTAGAAASTPLPVAVEQELRTHPLPGRANLAELPAVYDHGALTPALVLAVTPYSRANSSNLSPFGNSTGVVFSSSSSPSSRAAPRRRGGAPPPSKPQ